MSDAAGSVELGGRELATETLLDAVLLVNSLVLFVMLYVFFTDAGVRPFRFTVYGLLWLAAAAWVFARVDAPQTDAGTRRRAALVTVGYFAVLAYAGGLVGRGSPEVATGLRVALLPPGWGPALSYSGALVSVVLMPARVAGYLALAYLVYVTVVDAAANAVSGVLGLLSCVSCSWPVLASLVAGTVGTGTGLYAATMTYSYDLSTVVFLTTVALLAWRPVAGGD